MATDPVKVEGDRSTIPEANIDPFTVSALCAASALADLTADVDVVEFVRNFPAEQRQAVGLMSSMLFVGMTETGRVIVGNIFEDETVWRDSQNLGEKPPTIF